MTELTGRIHEIVNQIFELMPCGIAGATLTYQGTGETYGLEAKTGGELIVELAEFDIGNVFQPGALLRLAFRRIVHAKP